MTIGVAMKSFLSSIISLFRGVTVPGFDYSFYELFIGLAVVSLSIVLARRLLRIGGKTDDD